MADDTKNATPRGRSKLGSRQNVEQNRLAVVVSTVEVAAAASAASTYTMARIPASARILGASTVYFDDLASTGAPTIDFGLKAVDSNITTDVDALNDGVDVATAAGSAKVVKDIQNYGKAAWEFVSGQTADPTGFLDVTVTILDAAANTGGTVTMELYLLTDG